MRRQGDIPPVTSGRAELGRRAGKLPIVRMDSVDTIEGVNSFFFLDISHIECVRCERRLRGEDRGLWLKLGRRLHV